MSYGRSVPTVPKSGYAVLLLNVRAARYFTIFASFFKEEFLRGPKHQLSRLIESLPYSLALLSLLT